MKNERTDPHHILVAAQRGENQGRATDLLVGCAFVVSGLGALLTLGWSGLGWGVIGISAVVWAGSVLLYSGLYSIWGQLRVDVDDGWCTVTWILGRYRRSVRFRQADVRRIVRINDTHPWTSACRAGWQLSVDVAWRKRPIRIGGGLQLDEAMLEAIEQAIGPEHPRQMFER